MEFLEFVDDLHRRYGAEAADVRHEVFFIHRRVARLGARLRAALAALRDAALCLSLGVPSRDAGDTVVVVSRAGSSGLDALRPCIDDLDRRGIAYRYMVHPRLRFSVEGTCPGRPSLKTWLHALRAFGARFVDPDERAFVVRCCLFRLRLWQGAWSRALADKPGKHLILHNDFELFCVAAVRAGEPRWRTICVQHGLPTDEFFPTVASRQIVWGKAAAWLHLAQGTRPEALRFGPAWPTPRRASRAIPLAIRLVSQTHSPIYGRSLAGDFLALAEQLADRSFAPATFAILLHPEEVRLGHPYGTSRLAGLCRRPPHPEFAAEMLAASVLVGFCSTALVAAARRGHLVIGMNWPVTGSQAALSVGRVANLADTVDQLCDMLDRLARDPAEYDRMLRVQDEWLARCFSHGTDWLEEGRT